MIMLESHFIEILKNFFRRRILLDGAVTIETDEIRGRHRGAELELGQESLLYGMLEFICGHVYNKMNMSSSMMLCVILQS